MISIICSLLITQCSILGLTNIERIHHNLPAFHESRQLDFAAQAKAEDMLNRHYFAHYSPDGKSPWQFILSAGYEYDSAGENLAINFITAESEEKAWMNSPTHAANILNPHFTDIGVGVAGNDVVVMFGSPLK
jgi:uncharacterized protein YkwD